MISWARLTGRLSPPVDELSFPMAFSVVHVVMHRLLSGMEPNETVKTVDSLGLGSSRSKILVKANIETRFDPLKRIREFNAKPTVDLIK